VLLVKSEDFQRALVFILYYSLHCMGSMIVIIRRHRKLKKKNLSLVKKFSLNSILTPEEKNHTIWRTEGKRQRLHLLAVSQVLVSPSQIFKTLQIISLNSIKKVTVAPCKYSNTLITIYNQWKVALSNTSWVYSFMHYWLPIKL